MNVEYAMLYYDSDDLLNEDSAGDKYILRWDSHVVVIRAVADLDALNQVAQHGWRLVAAMNNNFYLEREVMA